MRPTPSPIGRRTYYLIARSSRGPCSSFPPVNRDRPIHRTPRVLQENTILRKNIMLIAAILAPAAAPAFAASAAPANIQAALILKLMPMVNNLGSREYKIHVVGAPDVAALLQAEIGKMTGKAKLIAVTWGDSLPGEPVDVIYIGKDAGPATAYSQSNGALSITGNPALIKAGVTLGIGLENKKPKIFLNLASSKAEGIDWNPAILKLAQTVG